MTTIATALSLAWQHQQAGNLAQAEAICRQVLGAAPQEVGALYLLGVVCQLQGRVAESIALYQQSLRINPDIAAVHNNLGVAHAAQGQLNEAVACYREAIRLGPANAAALNNLGQALVALGQQQEAIACYQEALRLNPEDVSAYINLCMAQDGRGAAAPPVVSSPQASSGPATAEALNDRGVALMGEGRLDEALAHWQQAVSLKELPEAYNNLGFLHASRGEWDQAVASYRRALASRPQYPEALSNLGIAHFQQHRVDEAVQCFREALALRPQYAEALNNLGNALLSQGKPAESIDCYREALRLQPNDARAYNGLGGAYRALRQWDEAVACLQNSLAHNATAPATHRNLGNLFYDQGKYDDALTSYQQVLTLSPEDAEARLLVEALRGTSPPAQVPADYLITLFDGYADNFDHDLVERLGYRGPELLKAALEPAPAESMPPRSLAVLDLGCGTGLCGRQFRDWATTLIGVDLSAEMLAKARERGIYDELIASDLLAPVQDSEGKFDLVLAGDVLVYIGDLGPLMQAVHRALRPGGRFAFTVELLEGPDYRLLPTLRFAHSRAYLQSAAAQAHLNEVCMNEAVIRAEGAQPVVGLVVVLSRQQE